MSSDTLAVPAAASPAAAGPARGQTAWGAIAVISLALFSASTMRSVFAPLQEAAKADLHLTDVQLSLAQGLAAALPVAVLAVPLGRLTDRSNRMWLIIAMAATWTAGTLLTGFAWDFPSLFVGRMLAGLGAMSAVPVAVSLTSDLCPPHIRGRAMMPLTMGIQIGTAAAILLAAVLFGALKQHAVPGLALLPWRATQLVFGAASALAILPMLWVREPTRHEISTGAEHIGLGAAMKEIGRRWTFLLPLFVGQVGVVMADVAATIWAVPVLSRSYHVPPEQAGPLLFLPLLIGGVLGAVGGGVAADLCQRLKMRGGVLLGAVVVSALCIPAALYPIAPTAQGMAWTLFAFILGGGIAGLITATALALLIPNEIRGLCLAAFMVVASLLGFGVGPTLVTLVSGAMGGESQLGMALGVTGLAVSAASFLGFLIAMLKAPRKAA